MTDIFPITPPKRKRPELMTFSLGEEHEVLRAFLTERAKELGLTGGASELLQRLAYEEQKHPKKHRGKLPGKTK